MCPFDNHHPTPQRAMPLEPLHYSDTCPLECFHDSYFKQHLDWMMQSNDLTNECGFQTHQMPLQCYFMCHELMALKLDVSETNEDKCNDFFYPFLKSLEIQTDNGTPLSDNAIQRGKALAFVDQALDSLQKHFKRWVTPKMLPAALMADKPFALVVARLITGAPPADPVMEQWDDGAFEMTHHSQSHERHKRLLDWLLRIKCASRFTVNKLQVVQPQLLLDCFY